MMSHDMDDVTTSKLKIGN